MEDGHERTFITKGGMLVFECVREGANGKTQNTISWTSF